MSTPDHDPFGAFIVLISRVVVVAVLASGVAALAFLFWLGWQVASALGPAMDLRHAVHGSRGFW